MTAKRRKLQRLPHAHITPEILPAFQLIQKLETQCSCKSHDHRDECRACQEWWAKMAQIHRALALPPHVWPCLPDPHAKSVSPSAQALYEELQAVL